jgi:hypothetical protein
METGQVAHERKNILDLILTNMSDLHDEVLHIPPIGRSDHQ